MCIIVIAGAELYYCATAAAVVVIKNYRITGKGGRKKLAIALLALSYLTLTLTVYIENESALEAAGCK